jgi:L-seryl-tRNA(Ser) seleniumtransferase
MDKQELLKKLPKIDEVLKDQRLFAFFGATARELIVDSIREIIDEMRSSILASRGELSLLPYDEMMDRILDRLTEKKEKSLRRMINATGVVLHTNLGRAKLSEDACQSVIEVVSNYSTLEYNVKKGVRGSRHDHLERLITKITGAEAAMIVNNNAAATMLCLSSMTAGREVIVSRGELVEIGGSFRVPEIMEQSGAILVEVGTTNKTCIEDYQKAVHKEKTGALMKVHTSNYKILGFTAEVMLTELVNLGREENLPVIYDLGSGLMLDLHSYGIDEPTVIDSLKTGVDVILFSGDKLLGGPQAGIITGKKEYIEAMKKHPLARVFRVDKMTLAAMEGTFRAYLDMEKAINDIPVLSMVTMPPEKLKERAAKMAEKLDHLKDIYQVEVIKAEGQVGGGSAPAAILESYAVTITSDLISSEKLERELRGWHIPIIVRIYQDKVYIDIRTVTGEEVEQIISALTALAHQLKKMAEPGVKENA